MTALWLCASCALGVALALYGESSGRIVLQWLGKPLAAISFVVAALYWGAWESTYGKTLLFGLCLGAVGDVLLIPRWHARTFMGALNLFLLSHVAYVIAFAALPLHGGAAALTAAAVVGTGIALAFWLLPQISEDLRTAVLTYFGVVGVMLVTAVSACWAGASALIAIGALGLFVSDVAMARERFVCASPLNRLVGMPVYFASQMVLAASVATVTGA
ncbi:MAG: lysoplasmalogenase family protein [Algiphilus sp.]